MTSDHMTGQTIYTRQMEVLCSLKGVVVVLLCVGTLRAADTHTHDHAITCRLSVCPSVRL